MIALILPLFRNYARIIHEALNVGVCVACYFFDVKVRKSLLGGLPICRRLRASLSLLEKSLCTCSQSKRCRWLVFCLGTTIQASANVLFLHKIQT